MTSPPAAFPTVEKLVPHRNSMLLLDALTFYSDTKTEASALIKDQSITLKNGEFCPEWGVELMAQAAAMGIGYEHFLSGNKPPLGYLIAIDEFDWFPGPKITAGTEMRVLAEVDHITPPLGVFRTEIFVGAERRASARLKFFLEEQREENS